MILRDRPKHVIIDQTLVLSITFSGIVQVGDVFGEVSPFSYGESYGGYRGAPSFVTKEVAERIDTRLHYANQLDEDVRDANILGRAHEVLRPNIRGEKAR
ncbi:MAG TPA: hypothetical protein VFV52_11010 [Bacilli bacterium]|nr:hypothetical protein [Bacilli bacterium]